MQKLDTVKGYVIFEKEKYRTCSIVLLRGFEDQ